MKTIFAAVVVLFLATCALAQQEASVEQLSARVRVAEGKQQVELLRQLAAKGEPALASLLAFMSEEEGALANGAMQHAFKFKDSRVLPALLRKLDGANPDGKSAVLLAIGNHQNPKALKELLPYLKSPSRAIRVAAAYALGRIGDPSANAALDALATDPDHSVRWQAKKSREWIKSMVAKYPDRLKGKSWWDG